MANPRAYKIFITFLSQRQYFFCNLNIIIIIILLWFVFFSKQIKLNIRNKACFVTIYRVLLLVYNLMQQ